MTQEELEVWNKEYSAICERKRIVEQLYAKDNGRFAAGSPVILKEPYLDLPAGVYVTTGDYLLHQNDICCDVTGASFSTFIPQNLLTLWKAEEWKMI